MTPLVSCPAAKTTLPLAQLNFQTQFGTNYNLAFASYLLALIPILIFYIFCQKQIIGGIANGAVKGCRTEAIRKRLTFARTCLIFRHTTEFLE
ncbi:MAG: hypothetical protein ACLR5S_02345 [Ruminococcus sp.]